MIRHLVLWRLKEEALGAKKEENAQKMKTLLEALPEKISVIRELSVGFNVVEAPANYEVVLNSLFQSLEDLNAYIVHPEHQKVGEFVRQVVAERASIDYEE